MASKLCDSCQSATAVLFCRADSAFLCLTCDSKIHAANKLASRHARVVVCEVCEHAPAHVTCKADAASLCLTCDRDIHSANPVAQKHDRVAVVPFYDSAPNSIPPFKRSKAAFLKGEEREVSQEEEEEAASWLLPNPKVMETPDVNSGQYIFGEMDPYLDVDYGSAANPKFESGDQNSDRGSDGVVPNAVCGHQFLPSSGFDLEIAAGEGKGLGCVYGNNCFSHSVSSSSFDVGVVPDENAFTDISNPYSAPMSTVLDSGSRPVALSSVDREARVMRYREKRKNRKFEKTIRYASRKAYAETRPRIKGRFAKRTDVEAETDRIFGFGVVPTY